jgi:hypothetical protein
VTANVEVAVPRGTVYLIPVLSNPMAMGMLAAMEGTPADVPSMTATFVAVAFQPVPRGAIAGWSFMEGEPLPEPVPVTDENIARLLGWTQGGKEVAEKCSELYTADLFAPFTVGPKRSSRRTPTDHLTSQTRKSGSPRPRQSKPSSPNGSAGMSSVAPAR